MSTPEIHSRPLQELELDQLQFHPAVKKYLQGCLADVRRRYSSCKPDELGNWQGQEAAFLKALEAPEEVIRQSEFDKKVAEAQPGEPVFGWKGRKS